MSTTQNRPNRNQEPEPVRPWFARLFRRPTPVMTPPPANGEHILRLTQDLNAALADAARWKRHADSFADARDRAVESLAEAYHDVYATQAEMAHLLAWLSALHPASAVITPAHDDDPGGTHVLYLVAGGWQLSWPIGRELVPLFSHVTVVDRTDLRAQWDGHGREQIPERIRQHVRLLVLDELAADGVLTGVIAEQRSA
ncbi:hypothetical protein [Streptomyces sp. NPDC002491]